MFPNFSKSKQFSLNPNIVELLEDANKPMFDLILDVKMLAKFGAVLDFSRKIITIDHVKNTMRPRSALKQKNSSAFFRE